jgi:CRP/FNR family transcriptional regulator, cyclic AMP receptor protein
MAYGDIIGYLASAFVFATFYVRTMMPLRILAIASNFAFIVYAASEGLIPVLVLHSVLLPVNLARLYEIKKLLAFTRSAPARDESLEAMLPFMRQTRIQKGEYLFRKGDHAKHMYYLVEGTLQLIEINKIVEKGAIIGEIGMFSPSRERTASAVAATDCRLLSVDDSTLYQAYYQNPKLGFYLISLIADRFVEVQSSTPVSSASMSGPD